MDIIVRITEKGAQVLIPNGCEINQLFTASALLMREANRTLDVVEMQQAVMDKTIQKVSTLPDGLKRNGS
jgi:hypothetical protein